MHVKLDENMPVALAEALRANAHDVDTVGSEGLAGASDERIVAAARRADRILFTEACE
jgi:predicted nuclease of predicted toxin-antitoxin system